MAKIVRRLRPGQYWRIKEHESWFSDMSEQGLHFYEIRRRTYHYEEVNGIHISNAKLPLHQPENSPSFIRMNMLPYLKIQKMKVSKWRILCSL